MRILINQNGVILMATIILLTFLLLITGFVADFMQAFIVKRELQDALDAAVISAAQSESAQSQSKYRFEVGTRSCTTRTNPQTGKKTTT